jgi:hypothetical protein
VEKGFGGREEGGPWREGVMTHHLGPHMSWNVCRHWSLGLHY